MQRERYAPDQLIYMLQKWVAEANERSYPYIKITDREAKDLIYWLQISKALADRVTL